MELAEKDETCYVFYPHSVYLEYGKYLDEMDKWTKCMKNWWITRMLRRKINARELLVKIRQSQKESGYPIFVL